MKTQFNYTLARRHPDDTPLETHCAECGELLVRRKNVWNGREHVPGKPLFERPGRTTILGSHLCAGCATSCEHAAADIFAAAMGRYCAA